MNSSFVIEHHLVAKSVHGIMESWIPLQDTWSMNDPMNIQKTKFITYIYILL